MYPLIDKQETGTNLRKIMDERGVSAKDVQQYLGLGCVQSVYRWLDGINVPSVDNLYALSEFFQVSIDSIVKGNRTFKVSEFSGDICERLGKRLYAYYQKVYKMSAA